MDIHTSIEIIKPLEYTLPGIHQPLSAQQEKESLPPPYLAEAREFLENLREQLEALNKEMTALKTEGKNPERIDRIHKILDSSLYRFGDFGFNGHNRLYNQVIQVGRHMDQQVFLNLGTSSCWSEEIDVISLRGFNLEAEGEFWDKALEKNLDALDLELVKIDAYLKRVEYFTDSERITRRPGGDTDILRPLIPGLTPGEMESLCLQRTGDWIDLTIHLLEDLRERAEKGWEKPSRELLYLEELVAEMDRIASHAQFNGMNLFTGRFARTGEVFPLLYTGGERKEVEIPTLTSRALLGEAFGINDWQELDLAAAFKSRENYPRVLSALDRKKLELETASREIKKRAGKIPRKAPFSAPLSSLLAGKSARLERLLTPGVDNQEVPPGLNILEQEMLMNLAADQALDRISRMVEELRTGAVSASSTMFDNEQEEITFRFQEKVKEMLRFSPRFKGRPLFQPSRTPERMVRMNGSSISLYTLLPLDPSSLGLMGWDGATLPDISSPGTANRMLGILDAADGIILRNRFILKANRLTLLGAIENPSPRQVMEELRYYAWMMSSPVYTHQDRENFSLFFKALGAFLPEVSEWLPAWVLTPDEGKILEERLTGVLEKL